jgi:hypothetical protein
METKSTSGTLVDKKHLAWLSAGDLIQFCRRENLKGIKDCIGISNKPPKILIRSFLLI